MKPLQTTNQDNGKHRNELNWPIQDRLHVAHAPHRWYALEEKEHGVNQLRVVGGVCDCCLRVAMQFYDGSEKSSFSLSPQSSSSNELESQSDIEVASMAVGGAGGVGAAGGGAADEKEEDS